mgnify:CR=1 FL=1
MRSTRPDPNRPLSKSGPTRKNGWCAGCREALSSFRLHAPKPQQRRISPPRSVRRLKSPAMKKPGAQLMCMKMPTSSVFRPPVRKDAETPSRETASRYAQVLIGVSVFY